MTAHTTIKKISLGFLLMWSAGSWASDLYVTPRGLSMGRAMAAISDDYSSIYFNPAGLAQIETWQLRLFDWVNARVSKELLTITKKTKDLKTSDGTATNSIAKQLRVLDGTGLSAGADMMGFGWFRKGMAVAINPLAVNGSVRLRVPSLFFAQAKTTYTMDSFISIGIAKSFFENKLRAGVVVRPFMARVGWALVLENDSIVQLQKGADKVIEANKSNAGAGYGYDADFGLQGQFGPYNYYEDFGIKPLWGIVLENSVGTRFPGSLGLSGALAGARPPGMKRKMHFGTGFTMTGLGSLYPTFSFEWKDVLVPVNSVYERMAAGVELAVKPRSWFMAALRGHFYKGNIGGGIGGRLWKGELEMGTYAVNLGNGAGIGVDRLYYISLSTFL